VSFLGISHFKKGQHDNRKRRGTEGAKPGGRVFVYVSLVPGLGRFQRLIAGGFGFRIPARHSPVRGNAAGEINRSRNFIDKARRKAMAAIAKQGTYLGVLLTGFTAFVAGLAAGGGLGIVIALVGVGLLLYSAVGFYRIKSA
jgi:hypothetical protein